MKNGEIYRGLLLNAEDTMNMTLSDVIRTGRNGQVTKCPTVYLRGSGVRFIALPDLLRNAPAFKKVANMKAKMEAERGGGGGGGPRGGGGGGRSGDRRGGGPRGGGGSRRGGGPR